MPSIASSAVASSGMSSSLLRDGRAAAVCSWITVDEVDLLQAAKPFADLTRAGRPDAVDGGKLVLGRVDDRVEVAEGLHDLLNHKAGKSGDARERPVASRRNRDVDRAGLPVVAEQLGEPAEVEQLLVRQCRELLQDALDALVGV